MNTLLMNNSQKIPMMGFGVYLSTGTQAIESVQLAIETGYRLLDTASIYGNEYEVGEGVRRSGIARKDMFITTKAWLNEYGKEKTPEALHRSLKTLGLDYIDLYLLHWPAPSSFEMTIDAYHAAELLMEQGLIKSIGVSNFTSEHLHRLLSETDVIPAVNQIELHPYFIQTETALFNHQHGIITQCWSPLGGIYTNHPENPQAIINLLSDPLIIDLANKYNKTPAQIVLRWHIQHKYAVIPKSIHPSRIMENFDVFGYSLTEDDSSQIDHLNRNLRGSAHPDVFDLSFMANRK